jgi:uncharacterized protein (DUF427 family)
VLSRRAVVVAGGVKVADSRKAYRVLETSHPPAIYFPPADVLLEYFQAAPQRSFCEFKGQAHYWDIVVDERVILAAAWNYPSPTSNYEVIRDYLSIYPGRVDACYLDDELVQAQEGDFYGGWITREIIGPFKGPAGTRGW